MAELFKDIEFPFGYTLEWGGLYEMQNESNNSISVQLPLMFALMIGAVISPHHGRAVVARSILLIDLLPDSGDTYPRFEYTRY